MDERRLRVVVSGDVQGVGFRWYCREQALAVGVAGSVRNLPDGRVEAFFEGPPEQVREMVDWCRRGPRWARVTAVDVEDLALKGDSGFAIDK